MISRAARAALCLTTLVLLGWAPTSDANSPWTLGVGEFYSEFLGSYYSSDTFHDDHGERPDLGATYETRSIRNSTQLGAWNRVTLRFDVPFESNSLVPDGGGEGNTQTGLSDLILGARYGLLEGTTAVAIEAIWQAPLGYHREFLPPLGEGRQNAIGLLHVGTTFPGLNGFAQASGGYLARIDQFPDDDPAQDQILFAADVGFWVGPSLLIAGSYQGEIESSSTDVKSNQHLLGPRIVYRVDNFLDVIVGSLHTVSAKEALHLNEYFIGVAAKKTQLDRLKGFLGSKRRP